MKRYEIHYYIPIKNEGGHRLVLADTKEKAIEMFKKKIADEGMPDPVITEVREI